MATLVSADDVRTLLTIPEALAAAQEGFRIFGTERAVRSVPSASYMNIQNELPTHVWIKGAFSRSLGVAGVSIGTQFGEYYFVVTDSHTGMLRGVVERAFMSKRRTGATAGDVAQHLARPYSRVAALIGAGQIGEQAVLALCHAFALDDFRIASRTEQGAVAFVERLQPKLTTRLRAVPSAEHAVRGADIIVTITVARAPFLQSGWLKPGALVLSMGGVAEVDYGVLGECDRVVVDDIGYALLRGDLAAWVRAGRLSAETMAARIDADIGEVVCGRKPGRTAPEQRILAVIQGLTICDLATAHRVIQLAERNGIGQTWATVRQLSEGAPEKLLRDSQAIAATLGAGRPVAGSLAPMSGHHRWYANQINAENSRY